MWRIDDFVRLYKNCEENYIIDIMRGEGCEITNLEGIAEKNLTEKIERMDQMNGNLRTYFKKVAEDYDKEFII